MILYVQVGDAVSRDNKLLEDAPHWDFFSKGKMRDAHAGG
jgi:hypothetical protein